jgi:hypothetical protein
VANCWHLPCQCLDGPLDLVLLLAPRKANSHFVLSSSVSSAIIMKAVLVFPCGESFRLIAKSDIGVADRARVLLGLVYLSVRLYRNLSFNKLAIFVYQFSNKCPTVIKQASSAIRGLILQMKYK